MHINYLQYIALNSTIEELLQNKVLLPTNYLKGKILDLRYTFLQ